MDVNGKVVWRSGVPFVDGGLRIGFLAADNADKRSGWCRSSFAMTDGIAVGRFGLLVRRPVVSCVFGEGSHHERLHAARRYPAAAAAPSVGRTVRGTAGVCAVWRLGFGIAFGAP